MWTFIHKCCWIPWPIGMEYFRCFLKVFATDFFNYLDVVFKETSLVLEDESCIWGCQWKKVSVQMTQKMFFMQGKKNEITNMITLVTGCHNHPTIDWQRLWPRNTYITLLSILTSAYRLIWISFMISQKIFSPGRRGWGSDSKTKIYVS